MPWAVPGSIATYAAQGLADGPQPAEAHFVLARILARNAATRPRAITEAQKARTALDLVGSDRGAAIAAWLKTLGGDSAH